MEDAIVAAKAEIARIGPVFNLDILAQTRALCLPLIHDATDDVALESDVPYGDHPRQRLDIYGAQAGAKRPILLFVPGGGFIGGDKSAEAPLYGNLGRWFARRGMVVAIMNYRLAPDYVWPAGGHDVRDAVRWIHANALRLGGDLSDITLFGQSAGAAHSASYLFHPDVRDAAAGVTRAVLSSGVYDLSIQPMPPGFLLYYGNDTALHRDRSAIAHVANNDIPLMVTFSEFDPPFLTLPSLRLAEAVTTAHGKAPRLLQLAGHNHVSNVMAFGSGDDAYGEAILAFTK